MIGFFISIFVLAWKLILVILVVIVAAVIQFLLGYGIFWAIGVVFKPLVGLFAATIHKVFELAGSFGVFSQQRKVLI